MTAAPGVVNPALGIPRATWCEEPGRRKRKGILELTVAAVDELAFSPCTKCPEAILVGHIPDNVCAVWKENKYQRINICIWASRNLAYQSSILTDLVKVHLHGLQNFFHPTELGVEKEIDFGERSIMLSECAPAKVLTSLKYSSNQYVLLPTWRVADWHFRRMEYQRQRPSA